MRSAATTLGAPLRALILLGAGGQAAGSPNPQVDVLRADAGMTVLVQTALLRDLRFRGQRLGTEQIDIRVDAGIVTLTGEVRNPRLGARAVVIARAVPGVRDVNNELACLPVSAVSPAQGQARRRNRLPLKA